MHGVRVRPAQAAPGNTHELRGPKLLLQVSHRMRLEGQAAVKRILQDMLVVGKLLGVLAEIHLVHHRAAATVADRISWVHRLDNSLLTRAPVALTDGARQIGPCNYGQASLKPQPPLR